MKLVLASASPRRLALLAQIGVEPHYLCATNIDETPKTREHPANLAKRLAVEKACKAQKETWGCNQNGEKIHLEDKNRKKIIILAADTVVAVGRVILSKPDDEQEARECLRFLSGRKHKIYSAVCLINENGKKNLKLVETAVRFRRLTPELMEAYLLSGEWEGKAGAYAIQGKADAFVVNMKGSYSNVVGLPLAETMELLVAARYPMMQNWKNHGYYS